jgi:hypothetical protein
LTFKFIASLCFHATLTKFQPNFLSFRVVMNPEYICMFYVVIWFHSDFNHQTIIMKLDHIWTFCFVILVFNQISIIFTCGIWRNGSAIHLRSIWHQLRLAIDSTVAIDRRQEKFRRRRISCFSTIVIWHGTSFALEEQSSKRRWKKIEDCLLLSVWS